MRHASLQRVHAYDRAECGSQLRVRSLHRLVGRKRRLQGGVSLCLASAFIKDTLLRELLLLLQCFEVPLVLFFHILDPLLVLSSFSTLLFWVFSILSFNSS